MSKSHRYDPTDLGIVTVSTLKRSKPGCTVYDYKVVEDHDKDLNTYTGGLGRRPHRLVGAHLDRDKDQVRVLGQGPVVVEGGDGWTRSGRTGRESSSAGFHGETSKV